MFKLFKSKSNTQSETLVATKTGYPEVVEQIHNAFNTAGDTLLQQAKDIIAGLDLGNVEKVELLQKFGFRNNKEVEHTSKALERKREQEKIAHAITYFSTAYPQYKFITKSMASKICEKYNLVLGSVEQYKGFVPEKNIKQIDQFFKVDNELNTHYSISYSGRRSREVEQITKERYERHQEHDRLIREHSRGAYMHSHEYYSKQRTPLNICAPLKDMNMEGYELKGRVVSKIEVPDPVVLAPVIHETVELYCIVTAWGDEASDEIVVNQQMN